MKPAYAVVGRASLALALWAASGAAQAYIYFSCRTPEGVRLFNDAGCLGVQQLHPALPAAAPEPVPEPQVPLALPPPAAIAPLPAAPPPVRQPLAAPAALPATPPPAVAERRPAYRGPIALGLALALLSWILLTAQAFRRSPRWGVALLLLPPAMLVYGLRHPRSSGLPLALGLAGTALAAVLHRPPIEHLEVTDSYLTDSPGTQLPQQRAPRTRYRLAETVYFKTALDWDDPWLRGTHTVRWVWIGARRPPLETARPLRFGQPPLLLQGTLRAAELQAGPQTVQVYVDDRLLDQRRFEIRP